MHLLQPTTHTHTHTHTQCTHTCTHTQCTHTHTHNVHTHTMCTYTTYIHYTMHTPTGTTPPTPLPLTHLDSPFLLLQGLGIAGPLVLIVPEHLLHPILSLVHPSHVHLPEGIPLRHREGEHTNTRTHTQQVILAL